MGSSSYEGNIVKEAEEEIGLIGIQPVLGPKMRIRGRYNFFDQIYTLTIDLPVEDFTIQEEEVEQVKWFTRAELTKAMYMHPEDYLDNIGWCMENL